MILQRLYYSDWQNPPVGNNAIKFFEGHVSDVTPGRSSVQVIVKDIRELLSVPWPLYVYQAHCVWRLYGNGCGLNKTNFTISGYVADANGNLTQFRTDLNQANSYFDMGVVRFTSGNLNGTMRTIKNFLDANNTINLTVPLTEAPTIYETFNVYPGCAHTRKDCNNKFNNSNNFRGFPFIPTREASL
jgi:uncharacterized phage protein (TIGR02218 family)